MRVMGPDFGSEVDRLGFKSLPLSPANHVGMGQWSPRFKKRQGGRCRAGGIEWRSCARHHRWEAGETASNWDGAGPVFVLRVPLMGVASKL